MKKQKKKKKQDKGRRTQAKEVAAAKEIFCFVFCPTPAQNTKAYHTAVNPKFEKKNQCEYL